MRKQTPATSPNPSPIPLPPNPNLHPNPNPAPNIPPESPCHPVTPSPCPPIPSSALLLPGHLTLLLGDPGVGKSLLALELAARLTNNSLPPPHPHIPRPPFTDEQIPDHLPLTDYQPASILALSLEDDHNTLIKRLMAAGADRDLIMLPKNRLNLLPHKIPGENRRLVPPGAYCEPAKTQPPSLIHFLNQNLRSLPNFRLLILDPLPAFLGQAADAPPAIIRSLLLPLLDLAEHHRFSILGISHLNKSTHKDIMHRSLGSLAYPALARSIYLLTRARSHTESITQAHGLQSVGSPRRLLIPLKNNLAARKEAYAFTITESATLAWEPTPITNHPLLESYESTDSTPAQPDLFAKSQLDFALQFLQKSLETGPILLQTLLQQSRAVGISKRTLERARFQLQTPCQKDPETKHWLIYPPTA